MIDFLVGFLRGGSLLTVNEAVLLLLILTTVLLVIVTVGLAVGAVAFRARTIYRGEAITRRFEHWQSLLHAVLYDGDTADTLLDHVDDRTGIDFLNFLLLYVRRLDGDERAKVCALAEPHLPRILRYLGHRAEGHRMRAAQTLGELGLPGFGEHVIAALDDRSDLVAMVAASTLANAETPQYAREVLARLDRFTHWRQDFLAAMLASMGAGAAPALRDTLADPESPPDVRAVAADALAALSDPLAADLGAQVLAAEGGVELRAACLRLLSKVGRAEHLEAVRDHLGSDSLPVRLAATRALGHFGLAEDLAPLEELAWTDPSPWVAIAAARALKEGGGGEALRALAGAEHPRAALGLQVISEARSW